MCNVCIYYKVCKVVVMLVNVYMHAILYTDVIKSNVQEKIGYEGRRLQKGLCIILVQACSCIHVVTI